MNNLTFDEIEHYKKYQYKSIDNTYFTKLYKPMWQIMLNLIPQFIHPNILTLCGIAYILIGYNLIDTTYGNLIWVISLFSYMNFDALDGMQARRTNKSSIIGEYFDHLGDLIMNGLVIDGMCHILKIDDYYIKCLAICLTSFIFVMEHNKAISRGYIEFTGETDVTGLITFCIVASIMNINLNFGYVCIILLRILVIIYFIYKTCYYYCEEESNSYKNFIIFYFSYKTVIICLFGVREYWTITAVDIILLFDIINYKIFGSLTFPSFVLIPIIHLFFPISTMFISILYVVRSIYLISKQLVIKIF
jgi:phosphatidylglycerophosphate synthase